MHQTHAEERCRVERIVTLAQQMKVGTRMALVATVVLGLLIVPGVGWGPYAVWAAAMVVSFLGRDRLVAGIVRRGHFSGRDERLIGLSTVGHAVVVNLPAPLFMPAMSVAERGLYSSVQITWAVVAVLILGIHPRSYRLYVALGFTLMALGWWRVLPVGQAVVSTVMLVGAGVILARFSQRLSQVFNESVEMRHQKAALVEQLEQSIAETAQAQQARSRFLAAASHDLLQPVHALMLLVGVLRDSRSEAAREQAARRIELTSVAIESMFRGLLDQARLDGGAIVPRLEPVSLYTVCRSIEAAYAPRCQERGLAFVLDCDERLMVHADAALLDRVLRNLVDNAVKFTERGEVGLRARQDADAVSVEVADTGPGIPPDEQARVFEAFYRGGAAQRAGVEGVGLGLSVTTQLLGLMGGSIDLRSQPGQGTRALVTLRAARPVAADAQRRVAAHAPLARLKVLVVEDDRGAREAMQLWLDDQGCECLATGSLGEALASCAERGFRPDCLVSDLRLTPPPGGIETIAALRARFGPLRAVLVTGEPVDERDVPADVALLHKPVHPEQLLRLLQAPARAAA